MSPIRVDKGVNRPAACMSTEGDLAKKTATINGTNLDQPMNDIQIAPANYSRCCPYNCFHPFEMKDKSFNIPAALFLNLICQSVNMPDEHAIVVLALIDRFCNRVVDLSYQSDRFYKRLPHEVSSRGART